MRPGNTAASEKLYEYLRLFHEISLTGYQLLTANLKAKQFKKGDFITLPGEVQHNLYFVKNGVQMSYIESNRKTHVIAFTYPPNLCAIPESFAGQSPSKYHLCCLTDSTMEYLTFSDLQNLFDCSQEIERLFRKMTEVLLAGVINRHVELHSLSMEERYIAFCHRSPQLLQLVPHKYLASYLGIDPTNFSKLYNHVRF